MIETSSIKNGYVKSYGINVHGTRPFLIISRQYYVVDRKYNAILNHFFFHLEDSPSTTQTSFFFEKL